MGRRQPVEAVGLPVVAVGDARLVALRVVAEHVSTGQPRFYRRPPYYEPGTTTGAVSGRASSTRGP